MRLELSGQAAGRSRRDAFLAANGFDVERYKHPSIEDIELGYRLIRAGGSVRLNSDVQCTHLKVWRFGNLHSHRNFQAGDSLVAAYHEFRRGHTQ